MKAHPTLHILRSVSAYPTILKKGNYIDLSDAIREYLILAGPTADGKRLAYSRKYNVVRYDPVLSSTHAGLAVDAYGNNFKLS